MALDPTYDVFLSHASRDKPQVRELGRRLKAEGLKPFLDEWHLVPGEPWQEALETALDQSRTFAVFLGPGDLGPWQNEEMRAALDTRVRDKSRRVIPVLLPGALMPDKKALPRFLRRLTWVDFRAGLKDPEALHRLVCGIKGISPEGGPAPTLPPPRPTMIGVPHRNPFFAGREALLSHLHQQLRTRGISVLAQAAIHGLGGIGKTQTAIEYAHRFGEHYQFVLWAGAEEETALRSAYLSIARELKLVEAQADLETAVMAVKVWLSREDSWLLIFDNADDPALVRPYLPPTRTGGKVLLTSRAKSFTKVGIREPFRVEIFDPEDAVKFLTERTGNPDVQEAAALAAELGYLPLALEQAAAYIETVGGGFPEYLARYRRQGVALFAKGAPSTDYPKTVATTWALSLDAVGEASPASADLLTAAAFLVPDSVPIEIFTRGGLTLDGLLAQALKGAAEDPLVFWELLEPLEFYSLVERVSSDAFKLHRLTQEVVKDSLAEESRRAWADWVVRALNVAYPTAEFVNWELCERLQPNARLASEFTRTYNLQSTEAGRLFNEAGNFASNRGDYELAKLLLELSLKILEHLEGAGEPRTLTSRNDLAETLRELGDLIGSRNLHQQNLEILDRVLGCEHPQSLASRINLAGVLYALGDLAAARDLLEQTLEINERVLGLEHHSTLAARNNLAEVLQAIGDVTAARTLHEKNLEISERILGAEHPDTLQTRNNLASALLKLGDFVGARKLHEENLEIREREFGSEHRHTLQSKSNLANVLQEVGDFTNSARLQEENLEIYERVLGKEHPDTLATRSNLGISLLQLGDLTVARKLINQNLEIQERLFGFEHPDTTKSTWNLLAVVLQLNDLDAATRLIKQLRWLVDRDESSILSADQRSVRRLLLNLLNPS